MSIDKLTFYSSSILPVSKVRKSSNLKNNQQPSQKFNLKKRKSDFQTILEEVSKNRK